MDIPLAPTAKTPNVKKIKAFRIKQGEALLMNKGIWHYLPNPVGRKEVEILVIFKNNTSKNDLIFADLSEKIQITK
jgi:ureidoglycolate hydrolase